MSKFVEMPKKIETNTASAEESTLKTPLSAQNQGVSVEKSRFDQAHADRKADTQHDPQGHNHKNRCHNLERHR